MPKFVEEIQKAILSRKIKIWRFFPTKNQLLEKTDKATHPITNKLSDSWENIFKNHRELLPKEFQFSIEKKRKTPSGFSEGDCKVKNNSPTDCSEGEYKVNNNSSTDRSEGDLKVNNNSPTYHSEVDRKVNNNSPTDSSD